MQSLNPCFNGRCTSTSNNIKNSETYDVLILVLMEDALVQDKGFGIRVTDGGLNPCFNGRCTSTH